MTVERDSVSLSFVFPFPSDISLFSSTSFGTGQLSLTHLKVDRWIFLALESVLVQVAVRVRVL